MNYLDSNDSLATKTFSRKTVKKPSKFYENKQNKVDYLSLYAVQVDEFVLFEHFQDLRSQLEHFQKRNDLFLSTIQNFSKGLKDAAIAYNNLGISSENDNFIFKELQNNNKQLSLIGEFNDYDIAKGICNLEDNIFSLFIGESKPNHIQVVQTNENGDSLKRVPFQSKNLILLNDQLYETVENCHIFLHQKPSKPQQLHIYELSISGCNEHEQFGTYKSAENIVNNLVGYNCLLIQDAIYQNGFDLSSNSTQYVYANNPHFGSRIDFQKLVDHAHSKGIKVLIKFPISNSMQELSFSLNQIYYWINDNQVDGIYINHQDVVEQDLNKQSLDELVIDMIVNELVHSLDTQNITITNLTNYPGVAYTIKDGGLGFDYQLNQNQPLVIRKQLENKQFDLDVLLQTFQARNEQTVNYTENYHQFSQNQSLTHILFPEKNFNLIGATHSQIHNLQLYKSLRLFAYSLANNFLNYMGSEFANPAIYQSQTKEQGLKNHIKWELVLNDELAFKGLKKFDQILQKIETVFSDNQILITQKDNQKGLLVFEKENLIFVFNFSNSIHKNHEIGCKLQLPYKLILSSSQQQASHHIFQTQNSSVETTNRSVSFKIDLEEFCGYVFSPIESIDEEN